MEERRHKALFIEQEDGDLFLKRENEVERQDE